MSSSSPSASGGLASSSSAVLLAMTVTIAAVLAVLSRCAVRRHAARPQRRCSTTPAGRWASGARSSKSSARRSLATRRELQERLDALASRVGQMNAHVIRLDALGRRLTEMANLDKGEFDFDSEPAVGGPEGLVEGAVAAAPELTAMLDDLANQIKDRERQLSVLESLISTRNLSRQIVPGGRPVTAGLDLLVLRSSRRSVHRPQRVPSRRRLRRSGRRARSSRSPRASSRIRKSASATARRSRSITATATSRATRTISACSSRSATPCRRVSRSR